MSESEQTPPSPPCPVPADDSNIFFSVVTVFGTLFVVTVLVAVALAFGNPQIPMNQWLNRHLTTVLGVEVLLLIVAGVLAMAIDRMRTLSRMRADSQAEEDASEMSHETDA